MTAPQWEPVASETADLLHLVATPNPATEARERAEFLIALHQMADEQFRIDPNRLRERLRGFVAPQRVGAYVSGATRQNPPLLKATGEWVTSTDLTSRNQGKPCRVFELTTEGAAKALAAYLNAKEPYRPERDDEPTSKRGDDRSQAELDEAADYRASREMG